MHNDETTEKLTVHVRLLAKPEKLPELLKELNRLEIATRAESGCEYSEILQNIDNPSLITIVEKYTNYAEFKKHMQMPVLRNFIDHLSEKLVDENYVSFHMTRIDCLGNQGEPNVEMLSFREDLRDRP